MLESEHVKPFLDLLNLQNSQSRYVQKCLRCAFGEAICGCLLCVLGKNRVVLVKLSVDEDRVIDRLSELLSNGGVSGIKSVSRSIGLRCGSIEMSYDVAATVRVGEQFS